MLRRSRFDFGSQSLELTISVRPWTPMDRTVGGHRIAASGTPASYVVRRDALLAVSLRFYEDEWLSVLNFLIYGQGAQTFTWYPEATDTATSFLCWLDSPMPGEEITPERDGEFPRVMELPIRLRGQGSAVPWLPYLELA